MKKLKRIIIISFLLILCFTFQKCFAKTSLNLIPSQGNINKGEEVAVQVEIANVNVAVCTLEIYWNMEKLEYLSGPENSNVSNNRILYTWVSDNGKDKSNIKIGTFLFKGLQNGWANIIAAGEFYNANGEKVEIENGNLQIQIGTKESVGETINAIESDFNSEEVPKDNTDLKVLRLNREGISPEFRQDIKEYYFIADEKTTFLNVTAIPKNENATVTISGNQDLRMGKNEIQIKVQSEDTTATDIYKIYVTRTANLTQANANLETLAFEQAMLNPEFSPDMTKYSIEIANETSQLNVLAIPQQERAVVTIRGNDEMKEGDNLISVLVTAEDGITNKIYEINVHRRTMEEEAKKQEEDKIEAEKLTAIMEKSDENGTTNQDKTTDERKKNFIIEMIAFCIIIAIIIGGIYWEYHRKKKI